MTSGPGEMGHAERMALAHSIAARLKAHFGSRVRAIGIYGSLARSQDGPYSDVEMFCVLAGENVNSSLEWSAGAWKAEVNLFSEECLFAEAALVEDDWPLRMGAVRDVQPLYDPERIFERLRRVPFLHSDVKFQQVIHDLIISEIYELAGKFRNARASGNTSCLPVYAVEMMRHAVCLLGLANRYLYASSATRLQESLELPDRPTGYDDLCRAVMGGSLSDPAHLLEQLERFWEGVNVWAAERGIPLQEELDDLLERDWPQD